MTIVKPLLLIFVYLFSYKAEEILRNSPVSQNLCRTDKLGKSAELEDISEETGSQCQNLLSDFEEFHLDKRHSGSQCIPKILTSDNQKGSVPEELLDRNVHTSLRNSSVGALAPVSTPAANSLLDSRSEVLELNSQADSSELFEKDEEVYHTNGEKLGTGSQSHDVPEVNGTRMYSDTEGELAIILYI